MYEVCMYVSSTFFRRFFAAHRDLAVSSAAHIRRLCAYSSIGAVFVFPLHVFKLRNAYKMVMVPPTTVYTTLHYSYNNLLRLQVRVLIFIYSTSKRLQIPQSAYHRSS